MEALHTSRPPCVQNGFRVGLDRVPAQSVGHRLTADGVELILPHGRGLTDSEARKLAWGLLADLDPESVGPTPTLVTYREAQRQSVLEALRGEPARINDLAAKLGWQRRKTERQLYDLVGDGRVERIPVNASVVLFRLSDAVVRP